AIVLFFFFQAEDGIRDRNVTGVQTCALPISYGSVRSVSPKSAPSATLSLPSSVSSLAEVSPSSSLPHAANTSVSIRTKANAKLLKRKFLNIIKTFLLQSNNNYFSDHSSTNRLDAE